MKLKVRKEEEQIPKLVEIILGSLMYTALILFGLIAVTTLGIFLAGLVTAILQKI